MSCVDHLLIKKKKIIYEKNCHHNDIKFEWVAPPPVFLIKSVYYREIDFFTSSLGNLLIIWMKNDLMCF